MNKIIFLLTALFISTLLNAQSKSQVEDLLKNIQSQTTELDILVKKLGRDSIGNVYYQRLQEYQIALLQLKSNNESLDYDLL